MSFLHGGVGPFPLDSLEWLIYNLGRCPDFPGPVPLFPGGGMGKIILAIFARLLIDITPEMRAKLQASLDDMAEHAKKTASPIDDIFVGLLRAICGV